MNSTQSRTAIHELLGRASAEYGFGHTQHSIVLWLRTRTEECVARLHDEIGAHLKDIRSIREQQEKAKKAMSTCLHHPNETLLTPPGPPDDPYCPECWDLTIDVPGKHQRWKCPDCGSFRTGGGAYCWDCVRIKRASEPKKAMNPPTEPTKVTPQCTGWCEIESVANGWLARTKRIEDAPFKDDNPFTFVFPTMDALAAWVREYFSGSTETQRPEKPPGGKGPCCPHCRSLPPLDGAGNCPCCGQNFDRS